MYNQFYGTDGFRINANGGQVFIEINFKEAQDYDNKTGLLSINESILFWKYPSAILKDIASRGGGISYMVIKVISTFKGGKFTQDLSCTINTFGGESDEVPADTAGAREPATQANAQSGTTTSGATTAGTGMLENPTTTDAQVNGSSSTSDPDPLTPTASSTTPEVTSPTGSTPPPQPAQPEPAPFVLPNPSPTARTTFAGARIKAYQSGNSIFVPVFLPSGLELPNVNGWGPAQWDAQIAISNPQDLAALTSLKASYDTVITPLVDDVARKIAENTAARTEYNNKISAVGSGTGSVPVNKAVVDDDATGG